MCKRCAGLIELLDERDGEIRVLKNDRALAERLGEREEEIRQLKELLGEKYRREPPKYGLTPTEWASFRALQDAPDNILHLERLIFLSPRDDPENPTSTIRCRMTNMRNKLRPHGYTIRSVWGWGYELLKIDPNREPPRYGLTEPEWGLFKEIRDEGPVSVDTLVRHLPRKAEEYADARVHITSVMTTIRKKLRRFDIGVETIIGADRRASYRLYAMTDRNKEAA